jgi:hypothetical protein
MKIAQGSIVNKVSRFLGSVLAGAALAAGATSAQAATAVFTEYTVTYDDLTSFGGISFSGGGGGGSVFFGWNFSPIVNVSSTGGAVVTPFALPSFTVTPNAGWTLSGAVSGFVGNIVYVEVAGGTASASTTGLVSFDGGAPIAVGGALSKTPTSAVSGYLSGSDSTPNGGFSSLSFSGGSIILSAVAAGPGAFAGITAQPQNVLQIGFFAAPVPEPESYIMLLAGLGLIGMMVRRRLPLRRQ